MIKLEIKPSDLKDILLHNDSITNGEFEIHVPRSRYIKILSDYYGYMGIVMDKKAVLNKVKDFRFYRFKFEITGNSYTIVVTSDEEKTGYCKECTCDKKRVLAPDGICYYKKMVNENYTTKIINYEGKKRNS